MPDAPAPEMCIRDRLTDTGGNAGSQSSTLVIRGLAVNEITLRDFPRVLWKELRGSLLGGCLLYTSRCV